jgi:hypothetical protein
MFSDPPSNYVDMREAYLKACEDIKKNSAFSGDISNVLQDSLSASMKTHSPTDSLRFEDLMEQDLQGVSFRPKLLTILPNEIPVADDEVRFANQGLLAFAFCYGLWPADPRLRDERARGDLC